MVTRTVEFNANQVRDFNTVASDIVVDGDTSKTIIANNNSPERLLVGSGGTNPPHSNLISAGDITNYRATFQIDGDDEVIPQSVVDIEYSTDGGLTWSNFYDDTLLEENGYAPYRVYIDGGGTNADGTDDANEWIAIVSLPDPTSPNPSTDLAGTGFMMADMEIFENDSFTTNDGDNANSEFSVVCFASDALIRTPAGNRRVDSLEVGDLVCTMDNGDQPIRWISGRMVPATDKFAPIRISQGALGHELPSQDLLVSRQHRFLSNNDITFRALGVSEVLVSAKFLVGLNGIEEVQDMGLVEYWHFMFDDHEIVFANDAPAESLFLGENAKNTFEPEMIEELETLFPECFDQSEELIPARALADGKLGNMLSKRMKKHSAKLLENA